MSFSYFVFAENKSDLDFTFPHQLTYFFEQYGGYEEKSEIAQVSNLLGIDLSIFQRISDLESEEITWIEIQMLQDVILDFIKKLRAAPDLYKSIKYGNRPAGLQIPFMKMISENDINKALDIIQQMNESSDGFPEDHHYIKDGLIISDLEVLMEKLTHMKNSEVEKIRLVYM